MVLKRCSKCKQERPVSFFNKNKAMNDGLAHYCKTCSIIASTTWRKKNIEKDRLARKNRYLASPGKTAEQKRLWVQANKERALESVANWKKQNRGLVNANNLARLSHIEKATPTWANAQQIKNIYVLAAKWNEIWPDDPVHVDHIIPLRGKISSGLHVETNLRIIKAADNMRKSNKLLDLSGT